MKVMRLRAIENALASRPWPWAEANRAALDAHWRGLVRERPALFDGRVLLLHGIAVEDGVFRGLWLETAFRDFIGWRDWGFPEAGVWNGFSAAALQAADGAYLLGEMGAHTANAGRVYFPCGTPDRGDVRAGAVDLAGSLLRELVEETGLEAADLDVEPGWTGVFDRAQVALLRRATLPLDADAARSRIRAHLARDRKPELADIRIVRGMDDIAEPAMPPFIAAYLRAAFTN